jgi:GT2 family glycosyltransferase
MMPPPLSGAPIGVVHLDLAGEPGAALPPAPAAMYFWFRDWPVGHLWLEESHGFRDLPDVVAHAVAPDVLDQARRSAQASAAPQAALPTASVVICTRDRPADLRRCLAALARQTRRPDQVIVVDNAPRDDATRAVALAAGADYVREDRPGLDRARNAGARAARGDIVLYTDDDVVVHPAWLARMVAAFDADHVACVTGLVMPAELDTWSQQYFERFKGFGRGYRRIDFGPAFFAVDRVRGCEPWRIGAGASMAFRRSVFRQVGLFDERLGAGAAGGGDDNEYWHRILSAGLTCRYEPSPVAFHHHRRDMAALTRQVRAYARGYAAALLVQAERTRHVGQLRRALLTTPAWLGRRLARRVITGPNDEDHLLRQEILGHCAGLWFYLRTPRAAAATAYEAERSVRNFPVSAGLARQP